jgi:xanthine dehydrogenase YagS FAD-binding subunit
VASRSAGTEAGQSVSFAGGGTDLLQLVKDRIPNRPGSGTPDVLVNLKSVPGLASVESRGEAALVIGGLVTLSALAASALVRERYAALAEAAESVATPQIRNVGTVAGNVVQRPWCWYYRNGFPCYKAGGDRCFSAGGENQLHAILGGGPSYIVHPSDLAPALVAFDARFRVVGPGGERTVPASEFFVLPREDAQHENVLATTRCSRSSSCRCRRGARGATISRSWTARRGRTRSRAPRW